MKTMERNYKGHKIQVRLTDEHEPVWVVLINDVHYQNADADDAESAIENAEIIINHYTARPIKRYYDRQTKKEKPRR